MDSSTDYLAFIDRIEKSRPFTAAGTGKLLGTPFIPDGQNSRSTTLFFNAGPDATGWISRAELRLAGPSGRPDTQFMIVWADPRHIVTTRDALKHFGAPDEETLPLAAQAAGSSSYLVWHRTWGSLSLGFPDNGPDALREIIFDVERAD